MNSPSPTPSSSTTAAPEVKTPEQRLEQAFAAFGECIQANASQQELFKAHQKVAAAYGEWMLATAMQKSVTPPTHLIITQFLNAIPNITTEQVALSTRAIIDEAFFQAAKEAATAKKMNEVHEGARVMIANLIESKPRRTI